MDAMWHVACGSRPLCCRLVDSCTNCKMLFVLLAGIVPFTVSFRPRSFLPLSLPCTHSPSFSLSLLCLKHTFRQFTYFVKQPQLTDRQTDSRDRQNFRLAWPLLPPLLFHLPTPLRILSPLLLLLRAVFVYCVEFRFCSCNLIVFCFSLTSSSCCCCLLFPLSPFPPSLSFSLSRSLSLPAPLANK